MTFKTATYVSFTHREEPSETMTPDVHISLAIQNMSKALRILTGTQLATGQLMESCEV